MKKITVKTSKEITDLLKSVNFCHDASLRNISFRKKREFNRDGSLIYPFEDIKQAIKCDVTTELLLNSFKGAKKKQIVLFEFMDVDLFSFKQNKEFDYSDIYEVKFQELKDCGYNFVFYATQNKIDFLSLFCDKVTIVVMDRK